ncbi:MAG: hypothetical protein IT365_12210 [Candidatus Hydrogenedentes bacterium]|nr:hypothetical protein [Candidatus Hydrogenedentota bacterium]
MKSPERPVRPFIGIHFTCCGVYARIYLNRQGTAYAGHCPKCAAPLTVKAGPHGSKKRFWTAG